MAMSNRQKRNFIFLTYTQTFMSRYGADEQTKLYKNLYKKLTKNITKMTKVNSMEDIEDCIKVAQFAWEEVIEENDSPIVELSTVLSNLYGFHEELYKLGISKSKMGDFNTMTSVEGASEIDATSRHIALSLYNKISKVCGFEAYKASKIPRSK